MSTNLEYRARERQRKEKVGGGPAKLKEKEKQRILFFLMGSNRLKTSASVFIRGSKHRETDESTTPKAECFYCF